MAVAVVGVCVSPARGAFPGRDGDLVVATGGGLELLVPATGAARSICTSVDLCGHPALPSFSANGQAIAFVDAASHRPVVVAADGSCLWCLLGAPLTTLTGSQPAFTPGGQDVTFGQNGLWGVSLTGGGTRRLFKGPVGGAAWSSRELVALVRQGWIWVGRPGHGKLRRLARGRSPSFSPDGARLAFARGDYVWIVRVAGGRQRRLVRGGAPAWSPSGGRIAYIGRRGAVEIVAMRGGRSRRVGSVRGTTLDWQPLPTSAQHGCKPPANSTVLASNGDAVVFAQRTYFLYGCLKALGRTQPLFDGSDPYSIGQVMAVRLAGRFAAVQADAGKPPDVFVGDTLYDLSTGTTTGLAGFPLSDGQAPNYGLDSLAVNSSGFAAWRQTTTPVSRLITALSCPSASSCVADDVAGNVLSSTNPTGGASAWRLNALAFPPPVYGLSCPSISLCVAASWTAFGASSDVLTTTDPNDGTSAWTRTSLHQVNYVDTVSCPSVSLCVAGGRRAAADGGAATILTSTAPTAGAGSWTSATLATGFETIRSVSCPSVSFCVAMGDTGDIFTSANPTGGASAWTRITIGQGFDNRVVSCPSASLCAAVDLSDILTSTDPTGGASAWTKATIDPGQALKAVSCPSVSLCVAGDCNGNILTSTNPTGGANAWSNAAADICTPSSAPCASEQLVVSDDNGTRMLDTEPPGNGRAISNVALAGDALTLSWTHDGVQQQLQLH